MPIQSRSIVACLAIAAIAARPAGAQQQAGSAMSRMEVTTSSEKARTEYRMITPEVNNLRAPRARMHAANALAADPSFGLARIQVARLNPDLTAEQRGAEVSRAIADMTAASVPELMFAIFWREQLAGRSQSALAVLSALGDMVPGDPDIHFLLYQNRRAAAGSNLADVLKIDHEFTTRFPDYAIAYNLMAYALYTSGDKTGALAAAATQMRLAPQQPNPHDTYADLLLLEGRYDEAIAHANASLKLDSSWTQGYTKIGAIKLVTGTGDEARDWFKRGEAMAPTNAAKADAHNWIAASYVVARDGKNALRELDAARAEAEEWKLPAATRALTHLRLALIEANLGNKANVATHLGHAAQINGAATLAQLQYSSLAYASIGDAAQARSFADSYAATPNAVPNTSHTLSALAAVTARDHAKAESELGQLTLSNALAEELGAEIMKANGKKAEVAAIKAQIARRPVKGDGGAGVDLYKMVARLRAAKL